MWFRKWHKQFAKFSPLVNFHSKVSKLGLWWDPFAQSRKFMSLKCTEELCAMIMKNDRKDKEELFCHFKIDLRNLTNFDPSFQKSEWFVFYGLLVTRVYIEQKKYSGVIFHDTENDAKFEENLTCGLKNDMENLANFHQSTRKYQNMSWEWRTMQNFKRNWHEEFEEFLHEHSKI